jgi:small subunit ribosomal protein S18
MNVPSKNLSPIKVKKASRTNIKVPPIKAGEKIDLKNIELLRKCITEQGKILPRRITRITAKQQRALTKSVKKARILGILPFVNKES